MRKSARGAERKRCDPRLKEKAHDDDGTRKNTEMLRWQGDAEQQKKKNQERKNYKGVTKCIWLFCGCGRDGGKLLWMNGLRDRINAAQRDGEIIAYICWAVGDGGGER